MKGIDFAERHVFAGATVSEVWGRALLALSQRGAGGERSQMLFVVEGDPDAIEIPTIREALDAHLMEERQTNVETVAWTIFPQSIWRIHAPKGRTAFFEAYRRALPRFVQASPSNSRGIYFARMTGFDLDPATGRRAGNDLPDGGNQLETILRLYERGQETGKGVLRIKLQVGIFDPIRDHISTRYLTFPCLQHVTFEPDSKSGVLHTNAFYATQQLVRKGYGNLLGLYQLGAFMAAEMGLRPGRLAVFVGVERLGDVPKKQYVSVIDEVERALAEVAT